MLSLNTVSVLLQFASALSSLPLPRVSHPIVIEVSHQFMQNICAQDQSIYFARARAQNCNLTGFYPGSGEAIYVDREQILNAQPRFGDSWINATIVHELVHYLQARAGILKAGVDCEALYRVEEQAYQAEYGYLQTTNAQAVNEVSEASFHPPFTCPGK